MDFNRGSARDEVVVRLAAASDDERRMLIEEYRRRSVAAFAPSTRRNYIQIKKMFTEWCRSVGHDPTPPVRPSVVAEYVDHCGGKIKASTIETRLWAIAEMHRSVFEPSPCQHRLVELALKGVKRTFGAAISQVPPLGKKEVLSVIGRMGNSRIEMRDKALLWVGTDTWCRASELVEFRLRDLSRQENGSSLLFVTRSKTDPYGQGSYAYLSKPGTEAVLKWAELAMLRRNDPIITKSQPYTDRKPLNPSTIGRIVKRCTGRSDVTAHSLRIGGVQDAFELGCDLSSIMVAGRWSSPEMPARYGRRILASRSAAAKVSDAHLAGTEG